MIQIYTPLRVLREGNSDRRAAAPVKEYAMKHPHKVGRWAKDSKATVVHMDKGDFFDSEVSTTITSEEPASVRIEHVDENGKVTILKQTLTLLPGEILDASFMSVRELRAFYKREIESTDPDTLFSLHLKATMMKVSDPVMFGHCVT